MKFVSGIGKTVNRYLPLNSLMRYYEIMNRLNEGIVYRDRFADSDGQRTVVAVNPTKAEWNKWFPKGAGGVLCKNGKIAVGEGSMLAHHMILDYAKIEQDQEKYTLQIGRHSAFAELWCFNDDWEGIQPPEDEVRMFCLKEYGETLEQIEAQVKQALFPFMGDVPVKAIPLDEDQDALIPGHGAFMKATFPRD